MKEKYGIYLDGEKKAVTEENEYVIDELAPGTEYEVGVSRIVNGRESDIVVVSVETETEEPLLPPFELVVKDVGDRYVEVSWKCEAPLGSARFNLYLDGKIVAGGHVGRSYTFSGLEPLTEYVLGVSAKRGDEEVGKVSVVATTTAPVGDDEPDVPLVDELVNLVDVGSFEEVGDDGYPVGWASYSHIPVDVTISKEWSTDGEHSAKVTMSTDSTSPFLDHVVTLPKGKYIAVVDFKKPKGEPIEYEGELVGWTHNVILGLGAANVERSGDIEECVAYVVEGLEEEKEVWCSIAPSTIGVDTPDEFFFDSFRVYAINDELYSYIKGGRMDRERVKEVFPYRPQEKEGLEEEGATAPGEVSEYDTLTIPEIKGLLDDKGIEYKSSARKSELIELLESGEGV